MYQTESNFRIKAERLPALLAALKSLEAGRWVSQSEINRATTVEEVLRAWRWVPDFDGNGDLVELWFRGEKSGDEDSLFRVLAPYVEPGSFIEMRGEDDALWRFWFTDGKCHEIYPDITWPDME